MTRMMMTRGLSQQSAIRLPPYGGRVMDFLNNSLPSGPTVTRASTAYRTNPPGELELIANDMARFENDAITGVCRGLLVEGTQTNLMFRSDDAANTYWAKTRCSVTADVTQAPNGLTTADKVVEDTSATTSHYFQRVGNPINIGETYTMSVYAKAVERTVIQLVFASTTHSVTAYANFDLANGVVGAVGAGMTARITPAAHGFYRCELTGTVTATSANIYTVAISNDINAARFPAYTGNGTNGVLVWGMQVEKLPFASSYIPTAAAATIRSADVALADLVGLEFNTLEGTLLLEAQLKGLAGTPQRLLELYSDASNLMTLGLDGNGALSGTATTAGTQTMAMTGATATAGTVYRIAMRYRRNDWAMCMNGGSVTTTNTGSVPYVKAMGMGYSAFGNYGAFANIRRLEYWPHGLENSQLKSISS